MPICEICHKEITDKEELIETYLYWLNPNKWSDQEKRYDVHSSCLETELRKNHLAKAQ